MSSGEQQPVAGRPTRPASVALDQGTVEPVQRLGDAAPAEFGHPFEQSERGETAFAVIVRVLRQREQDQTLGRRQAMAGPGPVPCSATHAGAAQARWALRPPGNPVDGRCASRTRSKSRCLPGCQVFSVIMMPSAVAAVCVSLRGESTQLHAGCSARLRPYAQGSWKSPSDTPFAASASGILGRPQRKQRFTARFRMHGGDGRAGRRCRPRGACRAGER